MSFQWFRASRPWADTQAAHEDFIQGFMAWRLWLTLGLQDIRIRYKRTLLGPWWITASQTVTFICMGMLFSAVLKNDVRTYLPYLAAGMVTWSFLAASINEAPSIFTGAHVIITTLRIPLLVHVLRNVVRNFLVFMHNFCAALGAHLVLGGKVTSAALMLLATLPLLFLILTAGSLLLAIVGARFRDLVPVIGIVVQLMFFMTPIMWRSSDVPDGSKWWIIVNPAYHLIETVRAPLLGQVPDLLSLGVTAGIAVLMTLAAYLMFRAFHHRIAYWL